MFDNSIQKMGMSDQFVPYQLKHVVTKYFDTKSTKKSTEKVNNNKVSLAPLYKCKFVFWQKEK